MTANMFSAHVEVDHRGDIDIDRVMGKLEPYHAAIGTSPRGYADAQISLPAENLAQACVTAIAVVSAAFGAPALACEILTEAEFNARQGWEETSDTVTTLEAASLLGVSHQRVLQLIGAKQLPAEKVGRDYQIPRAAVLARRSPTHPDHPFDHSGQGVTS